MAGSRAIDLRGRSFGALVALEPEGRDRIQRLSWECICEKDLGGCGKTTVVMSYNLVSGHTRSCGCLRGRRRPADRDAPKVAVRRVATVEVDGVTDTVSGWARRLGVSDRYLRQLAGKFGGDLGAAVSHCAAGAARRFPKDRAGARARTFELEFRGERRTLRGWAAFYGLTMGYVKSLASHMGGWLRALEFCESRRLNGRRRRSAGRWGRARGVPPGPGQHERLDPGGAGDGSRQPVGVTTAGGGVVGGHPDPDQSAAKYQVASHPEQGVGTSGDQTVGAVGAG